MYYLIKCDLHHEVVEGESIFEDDVMVGETVTYILNKKKNKGVVLMQSDDMHFLVTESNFLNDPSKLVHLTADDKQVSDDPQDDLEDECDNVVGRITKRISKRRVVWTPEENIQKTRKLIKKNVEKKNPKKEMKSQIPMKKLCKSDEAVSNILNTAKSRALRSSGTTDSSDSDDNSMLDTSSSIDLEEKNKASNIKKLQEFRQTRQTQSCQLNTVDQKSKPVLDIQSSESSKNSDVVQLLKNIDEKNDDKQKKKVSEESHNKNEDLYSILEQNVVKGSKQLFGEHCGEEMASLGKNIWCKDTSWNLALKAKSITSIARRLLEGVYKREALLKSTPSGQSGRCLGAQAAGNIEMESLYEPALTQIIEAAKVLGKTLSLAVATDEKIRQSLTTRLGEIRREAKENLARKAQEKQ